MAIFLLFYFCLFCYPAVSDKCSQHDRTSCVACVHDSCSWCEASGQCTNDLTASCGREASAGFGAWVKDKLGCLPYDPLKGNWSGDGRGIRGCTNVNAMNYRFTATIDDGSCRYPPKVAPFHGEEQRCICSDAAMSTPYGRFCGAGYSGAPGQQPCDLMDKCCQINDWCVGQEGLNLNSCKCILAFSFCLREIKDDEGFCGHSKRAVASTVGWLDMAKHACTSAPQPVCDEAVNCPHGGSCRFSGECTCRGRFSGYDCEECVPGWFPAGRCDTTCSPDVTCHGHGSCSAQGKCVCNGFRFGAGCTHNGLPLFLGLLGMVACVVVCGACSVGVGLPAFKRKPFFSYDPTRRHWEEEEREGEEEEERTRRMHQTAVVVAESAGSTDDLLGPDFSLEDILAEAAPAIPK